MVPIASSMLMSIEAVTPTIVDMSVSVFAVNVVVVQSLRTVSWNEKELCQFEPVLALT